MSWRAPGERRSALGPGPGPARVGGSPSDRREGASQCSGPRAEDRGPRRCRLSRPSPPDLRSSSGALRPREPSPRRGGRERDHRGVAGGVPAGEQPGAEPFPRPGGVRSHDRVGAGQGDRQRGPPGSLRRGRSHDRRPGIGARPHLPQGERVPRRRHRRARRGRVGVPSGNRPCPGELSQAEPRPCRVESGRRGGRGGATERRPRHGAGGSRGGSRRPGGARSPRRCGLGRNEPADLRRGAARPRRRRRGAPPRIRAPRGVVRGAPWTTTTCSRP